MFIDLSNIILGTTVISLLLLPSTLATSVPGVVKVDYNVNSEKETNTNLYSRDTGDGDKNVLNLLHSIGSDFSFNFTIGTPPQKFFGLISNLHGDIFVNSNKSDLCRSSMYGNYCSVYGAYNSVSSSTSNDSNTDFRFSTSSSSSATIARGDYIYDKLNFAGLELENIPFAVMNVSAVPVPTFGIGYQKLQASFRTNGQVYDNLPIILKNRGYTKSVTYSVWPDSKNGSGGSILFGGIDKKKYTGELLTIPIKPDGGNYTYTDISLFGVVGTDKIAGLQGGRSLTIALGNKISYIPSTILGHILKTIPYKYDSDFGYYVGDCMTTDKTLTLKVSKTESFELNLQNLITRKPSKSDTCYLLVVETSFNFILTNSLFMDNYLLFDLENNNVSIAPASFSEESDIEVLSGGSVGGGSTSSSSLSSSSSMSETKSTSTRSTIRRTTDTSTETDETSSTTSTGTRVGTRTTITTTTTRAEQETDVTEETASTGGSTSSTLIAVSTTTSINNNNNGGETTSSISNGNAVHLTTDLSFYSALSGLSSLVIFLIFSI